MNSSRRWDARSAHLDEMQDTPLEDRLSRSDQGAVCFSTQSETAFRASGAMVS